jgi:hypothetical protein
MEIFFPQSIQAIGNKESQIPIHCDGKNTISFKSGKVCCDARKEGCPHAARIDNRDLQTFICNKPLAKDSPQLWHPQEERVAHKRENISA